jgi:sec-independent protein translocase protein TatB
VFDIGFQELIIIFLVALVVLGPERLPEAGRTLGRWINEIRRGVNNVKTQMETELRETERDAIEEKEMAHRAEEKGKDALSTDREKEGR